MFIMNRCVKCKENTESAILQYCKKCICVTSECDLPKYVGWVWDTKSYRHCKGHRERCQRCRAPVDEYACIGCICNNDGCTMVRWGNNSWCYNHLKHCKKCDKSLGHQSNFSVEDLGLDLYCPEHECNNVSCKEGKH